MVNGILASKSVNKIRLHTSPFCNILRFMWIDRFESISLSTVDFIFEPTVSNSAISVHKWAPYSLRLITPEYIKQALNLLWIITHLGFCGPTDGQTDSQTDRHSEL